MCDQMLKAEHREVVRVPNHIHKCISAKKSINFSGQPDEFKLGSGHVKFFYDKIKYLHKRWEDVHEECLARGFDMSDYSKAFRNIPDWLYNDWEETAEARKLVVERVTERIHAMKGIPRYYSKLLTKDQAVKLMETNSSEDSEMRFVRLKDLDKIQDPISAWVSRWQDLIAHETKGQE